MGKIWQQAANVLLFQSNRINNTNVLDLIAQYDEEQTKDTKKIIQDHKQFFDELRDIDQIIVIGHSMSRVDNQAVRNRSGYAEIDQNCRKRTSIW